MDAAKLQAQAKTAFEKSLKEKIDFLADRCWPEKLDPCLQELNVIFRAGKALGVTTVTDLGNVEELARTLHPYRVLNMGSAVREILTEELTKNYGLDPSSLTSEALDPSPAAVFKEGVLWHVKRFSSLRGFEEIFKIRLEELNAFFAAMKETSAIEIVPFSTEEIKKMDSVLRPYITTGATSTVTQCIIEQLIAHGVDASIFD